MTTDQAQPAARPSERGAATRTGLLAAAREVFTSVGYAQAGITDIVTRAGASVGSLYHHFSGKADLFVTLYEEFHRDQVERTRLAVKRARDAGVTDPRQLFLAGARGYLDGCLAQRELSALFVRGDGPPGFDLVRRQRLVDWSGRNAEFFARSGEPLDEAVAIVVTGALMLAVAEISLGTDEERARQLAGSVIQVLSRIEIRSL
jgi:AcrR family transcriptional regulator